MMLLPLPMAFLFFAFGFQKRRERSSLRYSQFASLSILCSYFILFRFDTSSSSQPSIPSPSCLRLILSLTISRSLTTTPRPFSLPTSRWPKNPSPFSCPHPPFPYRVALIYFQIWCSLFIYGCFCPIQSTILTEIY